MYKAFTLAVLMCVNTAFSANEHVTAEIIPEEFWASQERVKLYMAYAEFKMANYTAARQMWLNIEGRGKSEAMFNLGILHEQGKGVDENIDEAIRYYLKGAELGSRAAAYQVGLMYSAFPGKIKKDEAVHWLTIAALDGDKDAAKLLADIDDLRNSQDEMVGIRRLIVTGQNNKALAKLNELAYQSSPKLEAIVELAWLYEAGLAVERDIEKAGELFLKAADLGNGRAQYAISVMYETGVGQNQDREKAKHYLQLSAEQGYQPAVNKLID